MTSQSFLQTLGTERVGALLANHRSDAGLVFREPKAMQFALVPEHELPGSDPDDYPLESQRPPFWDVPDQAAGHSEVEQKRHPLRPSGPATIFHADPAQRRVAPRVAARSPGPNGLELHPDR